MNSLYEEDRYISVEKDIIKTEPKENEKVNNNQQSSYHIKIQSLIDKMNVNTQTKLYEEFMY